MSSPDIAADFAALAQSVAPGAPRLPVETHVATAVYYLERIRAAAEQAVSVMRFGSCEDPSIPMQIDFIHRSTQELWASHRAYMELISCHGQA